MPLTNLRNRIAKLQEFDIQKETVDIINENGPFLTSLLKEQLAAGKDSFGDEVTLFGKTYYARQTVFEKKENGVGLGTVTDRITNYMTGYFYDSIYVFASGTSFIFDSGVEYFPDIIARSGDKIMGLNQEKLLRFKEEILIPQLRLRYNSR